MNSNSTELEQDVHAYWIPCRGGWPKGFNKCFPSQFIPVLAPTYSLPLLFEYLSTLHQCGTSLLHSRFKCRHVTQRSCSSWGGALRDDTINGCVADYCGTNLSYMWRSSFRDRRGRSFAPWQKSRRNQMNRSPIRTYPVRQVFAPAQERLSGIASAVAWTQPRFSVVQFICLSAGEGLPT